MEGYNMARRICALSFGITLFTTSAFSQSVETPQMPWQEQYGPFLAYLEQNLKLIAGTAAIAGGVSALLTYCLMRAQRPNAAGANVAAAGGVIAAVGQLGGPHVGPGGGAGTFKTPLPPTKTVRIGKPGAAVTSLSTAGVLPAVEKLERAAERPDPEAEVQKPVKQLFEKFGGLREDSGKLKRRGSQLQSEGAKLFTERAALYCDTKSATPKAEVRDAILQQLRGMTREQMREVAGWPSFWEKLLGDLKEGNLFFQVLSPEQTEAAMHHFLMPLPRENLEFDDGQVLQVVSVEPVVTRFRQLKTAFQSAVELHKGREEQLLEKLEAIMRAVDAMVKQLKGEKVRGPNTDQTQEGSDALETIHSQNGGFENVVTSIATQQLPLALKTRLAKVKATKADAEVAQAVALFERCEQREAELEPLVASLVERSAIIKQQLTFGLVVKPRFTIKKKEVVEEK
jgi:hypothetical protein